MQNWFIYPILAAFLFSIVNYLDKYIIEKISGNKGIGSLVLFSAIAGVPVILSLAVFKSSEILNITSNTAILMVLAGVAYLIGIIFYLYSIWEEEVSSVLPQMLLIPVICLILGYLFLGENLHSSQFFGGALILSGSLLLTYNFKSALHAKLKVFLYIVGASFFVSLNQIIFKYGILEDVSFWTAIFWEHLGFILTAIFIFLFIPSWRNDFLRILNKKGKLAISANTGGEVISIIGNASIHYGTIIAPVGLIALTSEGIQPFFLLAIGIILSKFYPHLIEEDTQRKKLIVKLAASILMVTGLAVIG